MTVWIEEEADDVIAVIVEASDKVWELARAMGPLVKGLEEGAKVLMLGMVGMDIAYLPNSRDLMLTKEANVALIYVDE